jgi:hypothetical protein
MPKDRYQSNVVILNMLTAMVQKYPDWRFNQLLQNCGVTISGEDLFYEESATTLERMNERLQAKTEENK